MAHDTQEESIKMMTSAYMDELSRKFSALSARAVNPIESDSDVADNDAIQLEFASPSERLHIAYLTIRNTNRKNALSGRMIGQLKGRLDQVERWAQDELVAKADGRQRAGFLVIRGAGETFCSGSDLDCVSQCANRADGFQLARLMQFNYDKLRHLPIISVAQVRGFAMGGGAELALSADFRLVSPAAILGLVHAKNGICCGWRGARRLVELCGRARALEILASGRPVGGDEMVRLGLAEALISDQHDDDAQLLDFLDKHAAYDAHTMKVMKLVINQVCGWDTPTDSSNNCELEAQLFAATWGQAAHLRALEHRVKHNSRPPSSASDGPTENK